MSQRKQLLVDFVIRAARRKFSEKLSVHRNSSINYQMTVGQKTKHKILMVVVVNTASRIIFPPPPIFQILLHLVK